MNTEKFRTKAIIPFDDIKPGDTGFIGDPAKIDNAFKIYEKGIGRKWFDVLAAKVNGTRHYDGSKIRLKFPSIPDDCAPETVELVYGNRHYLPPSVEVYGGDGVVVFNEK